MWADKKNCDIEREAQNAEEKASEWKRWGEQKS